MGRTLRLGLYSPYFGTTLGGGERHLCVAAEAIRDGFPAHHVELIGSVPPDRVRYEQALRVQLGGIELLSTNTRVTPAHRLANRIAFLRPLRNLVLSRQAGRFTAGYDLFVAMVYRIPVRCSARRGVVLCQFPHQLSDRTELDGYQLIICQSEYVRGWVRRRWGREATVIEPPIEIPAQAPDWRAKERLLLSVGRFFRSGHAKRQDVLVRAFRDLCDRGLQGWEFHLAGMVHRDGPHAGYYESVVEAARGYPIVFHPAASAAELEQLYRRASIFWHAAGYESDLEADPSAAEHFGMTTAEAMAWGAVPVAFAAGGQLEVVPEGTGRLWLTERELEAHTLELTSHPKLRRELGEAARRSVERYSVDRFKARLAEALNPLVRDLEQQ